MLGFKRIKKRKYLFVKRALCVCLIFTGVIHDISGVRSGIYICGWWTSRTLIREVFLDRKLTLKGVYSTETLIVLVRYESSQLDRQRSKELQLAVESLFCRREKKLFGDSWKSSQDNIDGIILSRQVSLSVDRVPWYLPITL